MLRNAMLHGLSLFSPSQYGPISVNLTPVIIRVLVALCSLISLLMIYLLTVSVTSKGDEESLFLILHHFISSVLMLTFGISITQVNIAVPPSHTVVLLG